MSILWNITFTRDAKISKCDHLIVLVSFPVAGIKFSDKKKKKTNKQTAKKKKQLRERKGLF